MLRDFQCFPALLALCIIGMAGSPALAARQNSNHSDTDARAKAVKPCLPNGYLSIHKTLTRTDRDGRLLICRDDSTGVSTCDRTIPVTDYPRAKYGPRATYSSFQATGGVAMITVYYCVAN